MTPSQYPHTYQTLQAIKVNRKEMEAAFIRGVS
jgi:hypothetical protein